MEASKIHRLEARGKYMEQFEGGADANYGFDDVSIRMGFIRKVYMILSVQLAITTGFVFMFRSPDVVEFAHENIALLFMSMAIVFVVSIVLICCQSVARQTPLNFILLIIFTIAESYMVGVISSLYKPDIVLIALGLTAIVCISLTIFAMQTAIDFTVFGGILFIGLILLLVFGILMMFFPGRTAMYVYCSLGVFLFSIYLIFDTQMIMGGNHRFQFSEEDYIVAALCLYIDIIMIFLYILQILGLLDTEG